MKFVQTLPFVALATAFVLPDVNVFEELAIEKSDSADILFPDLEPTEAVTPDLPSMLELALEEEGIDIASDITDHPGGHHGRHGRHGRHGHHGHHSSNLTIYQLISKSKHTTNFTKLVDEYDDIVELLNSTKANYTLFVPVNSAFEKIPHHGDKKPSKEFIEAVLKYHIGLDVHSRRGLVTSQTIPTALDEKFLGGEPQRLRINVRLFGVHVNFFSKVIASNFGAKNGVIHAVNSILVPPPFIGQELSVFPNVFSTLLLAYEKTDFVKFIHGVKTNGSTFFAPTNRAFAKLGPRTNAFLFNTEKGLGYLKALLKYQIVANATLYSDAYYDNHGKKDQLDAEDIQHYDLATLLHDVPIRVDIKRWGAFVRFVVNGFTRVVVRDAVARNGVVHVVDKVPLPPFKHHGPASDNEDEDEEIDVEELKQRLADYVDDEDKPRDSSQDWSDL